MIIRVLLLAQLLFCVTVAGVHAELKSLHVEFGYTGEAASSFNLYERTSDGKELLATVTDPAAREFDFTDDLNETDCHTYFMTADYNGVESQPSDGMSWCPETVLPPYKERPSAPTTITITINTELPASITTEGVN